MKPNSIVVASLHSPKEKIWGQLLEMNSVGVVICGLDLNGFDEWVSEVSAGEEIGLATIFYPLYRIERIALDEPFGSIPSLKNTFLKKIGITVEEYLKKIRSGDEPMCLP